MALEAVKIPADVQVEEKIVGPIGLRQLGLMMGGGGMGYVIWSVAQQNGYSGPGAMLAAWLPFAVACAFAFIKINDVSLFRLCLLAIEKQHKPPVRVFSPRIGINITVRQNAVAQYKKSREKNKALREQRANQGNKSIQELGEVLDKGLGDMLKPPPPPPDDEEIARQLGKTQPDATEEEETNETPPDAEPLDDTSPTVDGIAPERQPKANAPRNGPTLMQDITPPT